MNTRLGLNLDDGYRTNTDWGAADLTFLGNSNVMYFNLSVNGNWEIENAPIPGVSDPVLPAVLTVPFRLGDYGVLVTSVHYDFSLTPFVASMPLGSSPTGSITASVGHRLVQ